MFILASASPARAELLKRYRFQVVPSGVREVRRKTLRDTCIANAKLKAETVAKKHPDTWVLAADTLVELGGKLYGKPRDKKAALKLLQTLSGKTHTLGTGVVLQKNAFQIVKFVTSQVTFRQDPPIEKLLRSYDPTRFAGGYAIKEKDDPLVERVDGSVSNVIGLPMETIEPLLRNLNGQT